MPRMTIDKLALLMKQSFDELTETMHQGFRSVDKRFNVVDQRLDRLEDGQVSLEYRLEKVENTLDSMDKRLQIVELGQENILLKLDTKVDKIDLLRK